MKNKMARCPAIVLESLHKLKEILTKTIMSSASQPIPAEAVESRLAAIVLAAGYSSRMTDFKPLLPLAGSTAFERCIGLFRAAGVGEVIAVLGYRAEELQPLAERAGARCVFNPHFEQEMFSSCCRPTFRWCGPTRFINWRRPSSIGGPALCIRSLRGVADILL